MVGFVRRPYMRALRGAIVLVLALALSAPVLAADFEAGLDAYDRGDYVTALYRSHVSSATTSSA